MEASGDVVRVGVDNESKHRRYTTYVYSARKKHGSLML